MNRSLLIFSLPLLLFACILLVSVDSRAQTVDYSSYPRMDVDYLHLDLELNVNAELLVDGEADYELQTRRAGLDSLVLDASGLEIQQLSWNDEEREYRVEGDQVVIYLPDGVGENEQANLRITFRGSPEFGLHKDELGTIWSSLLSGAVHHWLPSFDHPRNTLTTDVRLNFPSGKQAIMNGLSSDAGVESIEQQSLQFTSETPLPLSGLSFAIGDFEQSRTSVGRHQIYLHSHEELLPEDQKGELLDIAYNTFRSVENHTGMGYPWRTLHIIVLEDDRWEAKNYGAGIVYAYSNRGDLAEQVRRGVASQWFGVQLREEQWSDAAAIRLLQAWLNRNLTSTDEIDEGVSIQQDPAMSDTAGVYSAFSPYMQKKWEEFFRSEQAQELRDAVNRTAPVIMNQKTGVLNWFDFANYLYERTGQPFLTDPHPSMVSEEQTEEPYHYTASFDLAEPEGEIRITFNAENGPSLELIPVTATEYTVQDTLEHQLAFTGQTDEIVMNVNPTIENLKLTIAGEDSVRLEVQKPFMFWIYQLRNDEDPAARQQAARSLRGFSGNPDLQLALLDFLENESHTGVRAEIIRTLSTVLNGASGTEQLFLERYRSDSPAEVRQAIVESLSDYEGNDQVIGRLQQILVQAENYRLKEEAARSLSAVTEPDRFLSIMQSLQSREEVHPLIPFLLEQLAEKGEAEEAVELAGSYLTDDHAYEIRSGALNVLLEHDRSPANWEQRLQNLLSDRDPRIRYQAVDGFQYLTTGVQNTLIEGRIYEEDDERVRRRLRQY